MHRAKILLLLAGTLGLACVTPDTQERRLDPSEEQLEALRLDVVQILVRSGNYVAAMPMLRRLVTREPDNAMARFLMGVVLEGQGQADLAEAEFRRAFGLRPKLAPAADALAKLLSKSQRFDDALVWHRKATKAGPNHPPFFNNLAYTLFLAGKADEAIVAYKQSLALDPTSPTTQNNLGFAYGKAGRLEEARATFERTGGPAGAALNMGVVYELLGRPAEARASYMEALRMRPGWGAAQKNLAALPAAGPGKEEVQTP